MVAEMSDVFLLLLAPAGGDELQGVKRGIMEKADMIVVNKADGALKTTAARTQADYAGALRLLRKRPQDPEGYPLALSVSALENNGLEKTWEKIETLIDWRRTEGHWQATRRAQARFWFDQDVRQALLARLDAPEARARMKVISEEVAEGTLDPAAAARAFMESLG